MTDNYFNWLYYRVCNNRVNDYISYKKIFTHLFNTDFVYDLLMDENRAQDGISLRQRYLIENNLEIDDEIFKYASKPCSVLEMMIALSLKCEEEIMMDSRYGDRSSQWFWIMMDNLGLSRMTDDNYNEEQANENIGRFLYKEYTPDGIGGLFYVPGYNGDIRDLEIWKQMYRFLDKYY